MKHTITAACLATCLAAPLGAETFTSYYAFGDSLTDDGKLQLPLPYFEGQFSSGPVWAEIIGAFFEDADLEYRNFALGGATAGPANVNANGIDTATDPEYPDPLLPFASFGSQIGVFSTIAGSAAVGDNPLVSVLFGANDIFQGGTPVPAAQAVAAGVQSIVSLGSQFNDFLVSTLPELGDAPDADGLTVAGRFNNELALRLAPIAAAGVNIIEVNQNAFQAQLNPFALGISNFFEPCLGPPSALRPFGDCTIIGFSDGGDVIRDLSIADTFLNIDAVHPSGPIQAAFADFSIALIEDQLPSPVPLPATLSLALAGLAGLGALGIRRRKSA